MIKKRIKSTIKPKKYSFILINEQGNCFIKNNRSSY